MWYIVPETVLYFLMQMLQNHTSTTHIKKLVTNLLYKMKLLYKAQSKPKKFASPVVVFVRCVQSSISVLIVLFYSHWSTKTKDELM